MKALVLERQRVLTLREIEIDETLGPSDVRIAMGVVGICGSDVHYYTDGGIGPFVVREPMVLGHEGAGIVVEVGGQVEGLGVGDRVCMEPGIPDMDSRASRLGLYNLDPAVTFWATPPVHGCLRESVVHPAAFTYRLPENVSLAWGAMVEPLAVGLHAATKARIRPGDVAVVVGAGTIGTVTALSALAGGCGRVIICDVVQERLDLAAGLGAITPVNAGKENLAEVTMEMTAGWGADIVFEASGNAAAAAAVVEPLRPGGCIVLVGMPNEKVPFDVVALAAKEARIETVFRYANVYDRAVELLTSGRIDVGKLITDTFSFEKSVEAFEYAAAPPATSLKVQIDFGS
ncbi:MAG: NAD(P)-dependent alcohol dehydrogenase [Planctomycetes bacterium]|nr:NAD(P)-dependent alcohol dehydrogenase [Planctomycetota bacterium]